MPRKKSPATGLGPRLTAIRRQRGMTQYDLAKALGVTQRTISYYESGAGHPQASTLTDLAQVLAVSTDELLGAAAAREPLPSDHPDARRLWKKFQVLLDLPDRDRRAVMSMLKALHDAAQKQTATA